MNDHQVHCCRNDGEWHILRCVGLLVAIPGRLVRTARGGLLRLCLSGTLRACTQEPKSHGASRQLPLGNLIRYLT